ncbi:hypothetical protein [Methylobacterium oryzae]|uniref:hypothetical protein n=1 Tax=Methylobacterium oryzae TaxID=334852 RepID=UPI001F23E995|nr:hypothetical protein [Methylobacterium oryzae]UIN38343.1 hypothetical protein LXM90_30645 [Methylobacterium oryzae]
MFLVTDLAMKPEADDVERGWIGVESVVHLGAEDAIADLIGRVRFSLGYELDTELGQGEPALPVAAERMIALWKKHQLSNGHGAATLRIDTRDFQHLLIPVAHPRAAS